MSSLPNTFGVFVVLEILATPFAYDGASALMDREGKKALGAYAISLPTAAAGLIVLGIPILGHDLTTAIGSFLFISLRPVAANPYAWIALWLLALCWIGGPRFVERMRAACS